MNTITYCACGNHECPLKMYVEWTDAGIVVVVTDDDGVQNNRDVQSFSYAAFTALLESLAGRPTINDKNNYYYRLNRSLWVGVDTFHLSEHWRSHFAQLTEDTINANTAL